MAFTPGIALTDSPARRVWLLVHARGIVLRSGETSASLLGDADVGALGIELPGGAPDLARGHHYLGRLDGADVYAARVEGGGDVPSPWTVAGLRDLFGLLGEERFAVAGRATQIIDWASTHRFCGRCATPTVPSKTERCVVCPSCRLTSYPRISPAIIVLVRRGEEALLARNARFPMAFYSTLAGFSEVGESLEETLAREVREEAGVEVTNIRYFGSQPWPFPNSLMVGFFADWAGGDIRADETEILDAGWFRAAALPLIPPRISIARRLIDAWVADVTSAG